MKRIVLLCALFASATAAAQTQSLIPRKILFGNPEKAGPQLSPDGKLLAYLAPEKGVLNVWVRTVGQSDDKVVTADKKRGIRQFFWQPGKHLGGHVEQPAADEKADKLLK